MTAADLDLEALREVMDAATPGPWLHNNHGYIFGVTPGLCVAQVHDGFKLADAALIVAAVNALPVLLDEVERQIDSANAMIRNAQYANDRAEKAEAEVARLTAVVQGVREEVAAQIHSVGGTALGVYTDDYQAGLTHATLTALTGDKKHPSRYTAQERQQMFGLLNARLRPAAGGTDTPKGEGE